MKILVAIAVLFLVCMPAHARLFETMFECEKRYGKHVEEKKEDGGKLIYRLYKVQGISVFVGFVMDKKKRSYTARCVTYVKPGGYGGFKASLVKVFLEANANKKKWVEINYTRLAMNSTGLKRDSYIEDALHKRAWMTPDFSQVAYSLKKKKFCSIQTKAFMQYQDEKAAKSTPF